MELEEHLRLLGTDALRRFSSTGAELNKYVALDPPSRLIESPTSIRSCSDICRIHIEQHDAGVLNVYALLPTPQDDLPALIVEGEVPELTVRDFGERSMRRFRN